MAVVAQNEKTNKKERENTPSQASAPSQKDTGHRRSAEIKKAQMRKRPVVAAALVSPFGRGAVGEDDWAVGVATRFVAEGGAPATATVQEMFWRGQANAEDCAKMVRAKAEEAERAKQRRIREFESVVRLRVSKASAAQSLMQEDSDETEKKKKTAEETPIVRRSRSQSPSMRRHHSPSATTPKHHRLFRQRLCNTRTLPPQLPSQHRSPQAVEEALAKVAWARARMASVPSSTS
jgi:hypothetical protein